MLESTDSMDCSDYRHCHPFVAQNLAHRVKTCKLLKSSYCRGVGENVKKRNLCIVFAVLFLSLKATVATADSHNYDVHCMDSRYIRRISSALFLAPT